MSAGGGGGWGDLHSHLVPGVDDGARTLDDALDGVERLLALGIDRIVTTPHLAGSVTRDETAFRNRMRSLDEGWSRVSEAVSLRWPDLTFRRGHEVMLDLPDPDLSDERIRLAGTSFVLVEWPALQVPPGTPEVIRRIRAEGFRPVVAHPERYRRTGPGIEVTEAWCEAGAYLQVTYGSLVGRYGETVQRRAHRLVDRGLAHFLSTDFHARPGFPLSFREARRLFEEEGADEEFELLARTNPGRLLRDEEPLPVSPVRLDRGIWTRFRALFSASGY